MAKALGKAFHKECLVCKDCGVSVLGAGVRRERECVGERNRTEA